MAARTKFWEFSSRNREGHKAHPKTAICHEFVLTRWTRGETREAISDALGIDVDTVARHLRIARRRQDPRAAIRHPATRKAMEAMA